MIKHSTLLAVMVFVLTGIVPRIAVSHAEPVSPGAGFVPTRFTIVDEGAVGKPDVILIPGLSSSRAVWENEAKLLAPNYRLHLVQVDGFAGAPAGPNASGPMLMPIVEELHAYIVASGMHPAVMGHSLGGLLTLMLADKHPEDVRKIIILDTPPYYALLFSSGATVEVMKPQAEAMRQQIVGLPADQFNAMTTMSATLMAKNLDGQKHVAQFAQATDRAVMADAMFEDLQTDMRGDLASIKTPALLLFAVDASAKQPDPVAYEAMMREGYKLMPNVTVVKVEDSRHFIMYDQPAKLDAALEAFLK